MLTHVLLFVISSTFGVYNKKKEIFMKGHQREVVVVVARGKSKGPSEKDGCGRRKDSAEDTTRTRTREKRQTKDRRMLLVIFSLRIKNHVFFSRRAREVCEILDDICTRFVTYMSCVLLYILFKNLYPLRIRA